MILSITQLLTWITLNKLLYGLIPGSIFTFVIYKISQLYSHLTDLLTQLH